MKQLILTQAAAFSVMIAISACEFTQDDLAAAASEIKSELQNTAEFKEDGESCIIHSSKDSKDVKICAEDKKIDQDDMNCEEMVDENGDEFKLCAEISQSFDDLKSEEDLFCYPVVLETNHGFEEKVLCEEMDHKEIDQDDFDYDDVEVGEEFDDVHDCVLYYNSEDDDMSCLETVFAIDENGEFIEFEIDEIIKELHEDGIDVSLDVIENLLDDEEFLIMLEEALIAGDLHAEDLIVILKEHQYGWQEYKELENHDVEWKDENDDKEYHEQWTEEEKYQDEKTQEDWLKEELTKEEIEVIELELLEKEKLEDEFLEKEIIETHEKDLVVEELEKI